MRAARPHLWPRRPMGWAPRRPDAAPSPIYSSRRENPSTKSHDTRKVPETPPLSTPCRGVQKIASGTLPERGIITEGLYITLPASGLMPSGKAGGALPNSCHLLDVTSPERRDTKRPAMASGRGDRIGALPDDLLHHVLSFLPAHEAVRTCVLARRWLHLWKSAPALRVTGIKGCNNAARFAYFVDNLLLLRDPRARLESFELDLDERDFSFNAFLPAYERRVNLWFRLAFACGSLVNLALRTTNGVYICPDDYETLWFANVPLISQHLARLELKRVYVHSSTLDFSGCPALIHLRMEDCDIKGNISSPFLKHLSIVASFFQTDPVRAHICVPGLVSLELRNELRYDAIYTI
ncbi:hypothetical protein QYE76_046213 [Lolium multiflorum]|uniref:F-box domain-containing protein n=1 Tax=Lolium multiflorum TaxID=4521 RepID=A0AAD8WYF6_LOLMU|nr:hypothetical protein QYE76_046213 [Lolium multiflorum]